MDVRGWPNCLLDTQDTALLLLQAAQDCNAWRIGANSLLAAAQQQETLRTF